MLKSTLRWESIAHHGLLLPVSTGIHQRKDSEQVHLCCLKNVSKPISEYSLSPYISLCGKEGHTLRVNRIHAAMEVVGSSDIVEFPARAKIGRFYASTSFLCNTTMSLSTVARGSPKRLYLQLVLVRSLVTESISSVTPDPPPLPLTKPSKSTKPRLFPHPRPAGPPPRRSKLPPTFGQNQLLPVSQSTRALLESIVAKFDAPIRYAFAYGSGVFEQDGYANASSVETKTPMLDFMFAVTHPAHFHSINMQQHPNHYPLHARMLGSSYVSRIEEVGPGVWFNAYIPMKDAVRFMLLDLLDLGADTPILVLFYIDNKIRCYDSGQSML